MCVAGGVQLHRGQVHRRERQADQRDVQLRQGPPAVHHLHGWDRRHRWATDTVLPSFIVGKLLSRNRSDLRCTDPYRFKVSLRPLMNLWLCACHVEHVVLIYSLCSDCIDGFWCNLHTVQWSCSFSEYGITVSGLSLLRGMWWWNLFLILSVPYL